MHSSIDLGKDFQSRGNDMNIMNVTKNKLMINDIIAINDNQ
jgi:hypothetical protein